MDGVSWSTTRAQESFSRSRTAADTLSRLASFIARVDTKPHAQTQKQPPASHLLPSYVCQECGRSFPFATELLHHQELKHSLPKPHQCASCGQEFSLRSSLQLHQCTQDSSQCERCHGDARRGSPCPACTTRTSEPGRLRDQSPHRQPPRDGSPYACAPCGRGFSHKQALLQHQQAGCSEPPPPADTGGAGSLPEESAPPSDGDSTHSDSSEAPGPPRRHSSHTEQRLRRQSSRGAGRAGGAGSSRLNGDQVKMPKSRQKHLSCRSCEQVFRSTSQLLLHRKEKHSRENSTLTEPWPVISRIRRAGSYPCQVCSKVFVHHLSLRAHYRQHSASCSSTGGSRPAAGSRPTGGATKDSEAQELKPDPVRTRTAEHQTVKAPGRPKKARLESKADDAGRSREVPEEEQEEEEEEEDEEQEKEFPCPSCAEVFSLQSELREHVELHQSSGRRGQCSLCTTDMDTSKWPGSRRQRLYHCVPCQQGFSALDAFLDHCQKHLRVRVEQDRITEATA